MVRRCVPGPGKSFARARTTDQRLDDRSEGADASFANRGRCPRIRSCRLAVLRSGLIHLTIIDRDVFEPHNVARHVLTGDQVGQAKAFGLAQRLNACFPNHAVAAAIEQDAIALTEEELAQLLRENCLHRGLFRFVGGSALACRFGQADSSYDLFPGCGRPRNCASC